MGGWLLLLLLAALVVLLLQVRVAVAVTPSPWPLPPSDPGGMCLTPVEHVGTQPVSPALSRPALVAYDDASGSVLWVNDGDSTLRRLPEDSTTLDDAVLVRSGVVASGLAVSEEVVWVLLSPAPGLLVTLAVDGSGFSAFSLAPVHPSVGVAVDAVEDYVVRAWSVCELCLP